MIRLLRILLAVVGVLLVLASTLFTWVNVDIDTDALAELAEGAVDTVDVDGEAAELIDDAGDVVSAARDLIPDRLLEASVNGQNAYDLFGFGFVLAGTALAAAIASAMWAVKGLRWVRWLGASLAVITLVMSIGVPLSVLVTDSLLEIFLPEEWKRFSPSFDITIAPFGAIGGGVVILAGLVGRSPEKPTIPPPLAPPPPPSAFG